MCPINVLGYCFKLSLYTPLLLTAFKLLTLYSSCVSPCYILMLASIQRQSKRLRGRNVHFESVTVYYFTRRQGFTSVPTQGGSTLGMSPRHSGVKRFTLREFAMEQKRSHRNMLRDHLKEEKLNAIKLKVGEATHHTLNLRFEFKYM